MIIYILLLKELQKGSLFYKRGSSPSNAHLYPPAEDCCFLQHLITAALLIFNSRKTSLQEFQLSIYSPLRVYQQIF